jgi:hypothetical protein
MDDEALLVAVPYVYLIYGRELTPTAGTPHLQGYVQLKTRSRRETLSKLVSRASWVNAKNNGSLEEKQAYCKKDSD